MTESAATTGTEEVVVMVGTRKGMFLFQSDAERRVWRRSLHHLGWSSHAVNYDARHGSIYAATNHAVYGGLVQRSDDLGGSWQHFNQGLDFPEDEERRAREVWQVEPGPPHRPDEVWAGTREAGLFRSLDRGATWEAVTTFNNHPTTDSWMPGGGGLILHTIIASSSENGRMYACVSAGGAYRSDDAGASWRPINQGVRADFMPNPYPESGQCVHKMVAHPSSMDLLYQQNHCGIYRSADGGDIWEDISEGLPSRFGFPMAVHPHDPDTIYVVPLVADENRVVPDGQMAVWRSENRGDQWERLTSGLPSDAWLSVLRDAMSVDSCQPAGIYVGTTTGQLFYSRDAGESWQILADYLPPILAVHAVRIAG